MITHNAKRACLRPEHDQHAVSALLLVYVSIQHCHATLGLHMTVSRVYEGIKVLSYTYAYL